MAIVCVPSVLLVALLGAGSQGTAKKQTVRVVYETPTKPEQAPVAERMKQEHILEDAADMLSMLKLPKLLTLHSRTCGESNAWYDSETHVLTFCYELVRDFIKMAEQSGHYELTPEQAVVGPFLFIVLHETAHAVIHILAVPVLGQEEDAADQLAVLAATHFGGDFADVHGLDRQRFYNVLCLAWGSDPKRYSFAKELGKLPDERAEGCADEYHQVRYAVQTLIRKSVDQKEVERIRQKAARSKFGRSTP